MTTMNLRATPDGKGTWTVQGRIYDDQGELVGGYPLYMLDEVPGRNAVEALNWVIDHIKQEAPMAIVDDEPIYMTDTQIANLGAKPLDK